MRSLRLVFIVIVLTGFQALSAEKAEQSPSSKKSTQVSFDDMLVQGKFQFSDEAVTTVEGDQVLDALLGVRTDFKDRIVKSSEQF